MQHIKVLKAAVSGTVVWSRNDSYWGITDTEFASTWATNVVEDAHIKDSTSRTSTFSAGVGMYVFGMNNGDGV